jgi:hypothetical protein
MDPDARTRALEQIRENINRFGYHVYVVSGEQQPRYAYTIGLSPRLGYEVVFAGGILFMYKEIGTIIKAVVEKLTAKLVSESGACGVDPFGGFSFRRCDPSWTALLMTGASDFYQRSEVHGLQILPDSGHKTLDVPDTGIPWSPESAPIWRYIKESWPFSVPPTSHAATDLDALRGSPVTEACRWEEDYWELFAGAGPDVPNEEKRVVGLGMLLAADPSLAPILDLKVGDGIWREDSLQWQTWARREGAEKPPA